MSAESRFAADEARVRTEQVRLVLTNVSRTAVPTVLLSCLLVVVLSNETNARGLVVWCGLNVLLVLLDAWAARRALHRGIPDRTRAFERRITWVQGIKGLTWASLVWAASSAITPLERMIVIGVCTGVIGHAIASLSPFFAAFASLNVTMLVVVESYFLLHGGYENGVLGVIAGLYAVTMHLQARTTSRATRETIVLRFQNEQLIRRLEEETAIAQSARVAAEHANGAKSRFLAAASHDLRQPIHAQGLFLELLARSALDTRQREIVANARLTLDASSEMLDALLDFSRIEAGVVEPQIRAFALEPVLQRIETEFAPAANQRELSYRSRETKAIVRSDPALVSLIVRNFVSNAIRYTDRGGLFVGVRTRETHVIVEVWDTGIGVPAEQVREIFREFHQLGNPERDRRKGLGLGLAIAGGLATLLGHDVEVRSIPGRGSVFRLMLPHAGEPALPPAPRAGRSDVESSTGLRILLVDDDVAILSSTRQLLTDWGYVCDTAESTEEALFAASKARPDIIVSDFRLRSHENGVETIAAVRALTATHIPAILITGDTAPERLREARASKILVLHKPVLPARMRTELRLLGQHPRSP